MGVVMIKDIFLSRFIHSYHTYVEKVKNKKLKIKVSFLNSLMYGTNFVLEKHCLKKFRIKYNLHILNSCPSYYLPKGHWFSS